jgi:hypothetical protein
MIYFRHTSTLSSLLIYSINSSGYVTICTERQFDTYRHYSRAKEARNLCSNWPSLARRGGPVRPVCRMETLSSSKTQQSVSKAPASARLKIVDGQGVHASGAGKSTDTPSRRGARRAEGLHMHKKEEHEKGAAAPSGQAARSGLRDDKVRECDLL